MVCSGITLIFYLMSNVFLQIFINPYRLYQPSSFLQFLKSFMFTFIIYGIRFGPKIFYALSGFILVFKFLHYLDNQTDKEQLTEQYVEAEPNSVVIRLINVVFFFSWFGRLWRLRWVFSVG